MLNECPNKFFFKYNQHGCLSHQWSMYKNCYCYIIQDHTKLWENLVRRSAKVKRTFWEVPSETCSQSSKENKGSLQRNCRIIACILWHYFWNSKLCWSL